DDADEQEVDGALYADRSRLAKMAAGTADSDRSLWRVSSEASAPVGRKYPPPPDPEPFWPAQLTVLAAIGIQILLPARLTAGPEWLPAGPGGGVAVGRLGCHAHG